MTTDEFEGLKNGDRIQHVKSKKIAKVIHVNHGIGCTEVDYKMAYLGGFDSWLTTGPIRTMKASHAKNWTCYA